MNILAFLAALIAVVFDTGADSAPIVMDTLSANGMQEPGKGLVIACGTATGAVAAVMLLAGGADPAETLDRLKNITIMSAPPFVIIMLLCMAVWNDLSKAPLIIQGQLASHVIEQPVATAVDEYDGELFGFETTQLPVEGDAESESESTARAAGSS